MAHSSSHILLAEAANHPPVPQNHVSYRLIFSLGGTYRELYRVLDGDLLKGYTTKLVQGSCNSLVYAAIFQLFRRFRLEGRYKLYGFKSSVERIQLGFDQSPKTLNPLHPNWNPSNPHSHPRV